MTKRTLISLVSLAALAAAAGPASAADNVVAPLAPGADVKRMTALDDTVVWVDGKKLMQLAPDGTIARVPGSPLATYRSIDLGHDGSGATVLTYVRCTTSSGCKAYSDDLDGHRTSFKRLAPGRCIVTAAPARWRARVAYGLRCSKPTGPPHVFDAGRSGVYTRIGAHAPTRLRLPSGMNDPTERYTVDTVDLRGTRVAALVAGSGGFSDAVVQTVAATNAHSAYVGGGGEEARAFAGGVALGSGSRMWTLAYGFDSGETYGAVRRVHHDGCTDREDLPDTSTTPGDYAYPATAMAVDANRLYLFVRGTGIVEHTYGPQSACN